MLNKKLKQGGKTLLLLLQGRILGAKLKLGYSSLPGRPVLQAQ